MLDALKTFHSFGLHDGEIFCLKETSTVYEYAGNALKVKNSGTDEGFGIRILKDKKLGFSYANSKSKIPQAVKSAISFSGFSTPTSFSFAQKQKYEKISAYDEKVVEAQEGELKEMVFQIAEGIRKHSEPVRIVIVSQSAEAAIANTSPLFAQDKSTSFAAYAEAKNKNGFGFAEHSHYKILENPVELGERAGLMAREMKNPKKIAAGKYSVIFSQETLSSLFGLLLSSFSGELKRRKISKLWDKEGEKFFDERLTVFDDPFAEAEDRSAFDGEGVASRKMPLMEKGTIKNFYYNRETAALADLEKQGNCGRAGYSVPPLISASNTVVSKGDADLGTGNQEPGTGHESELEKYLHIESMHGLHTANATTGDFGAEASVAFLHESGKKVPVRGFMLSENIFNLFNKIEHIGKEQILAGDFISPKIAFRDISIIS